ncbi:villin-1 isoform X1 [Herrania umbratica]|uniref:Villin-1 isoform X1 n=1 Tax=Herrania umbratica TaxID=108875 RepID=A0A6J0ZWN3_9ROSI|nr:villin-1 isoform X1 [Herrania umbratica]XP_021278976.1 villin-1 isoform X1 [Herrania umbratica]
MAFYSKDVDSAFHGAGAKPGLEIWCIEDLRLVPVPKYSHGKFYSGSAYVVLSTSVLKNGPPQHDIHYWMGNDANEVDSALASDRALELDAALGSCTVQYREVQGQETEKFLSYFKPCVIPVEGVYSSQPGNSNGETNQVTLLTCKGDHVVHVKEVPFSRSSLNHNDVFILETASKIFLFSGCNSSIQERAKALEVVQYIKENRHAGNCEVAIIEDGKLVGDSDVGEFWSLFGGYAPIPRDSALAGQQQVDSPVILFWINLQGKLSQIGSDSLDKDMLEKNKCYMLDCGAEVFVWMGRNTSITERKTSISAAEDFLRKHDMSSRTHLTFLTEGLETSMFKSYFNSWPQTAQTKLYDEGREKVAAIFKQQGYEVKELPEEDLQSYINCRGTLKVWQVNGHELSLIPVSEQTKLYSGDCYIVQYTYPGIERDESLFYAWLGHRSVLEDRADAIFHMSAIVDSTRGDPVMAQVTENREPVQFFLIFQTLIVYKGGISAGYKKFIAESGIDDDTYDEKKTALFRVQGTSPENMQAIQVDHVSSSLNSSYCYILQNGTSVFTWIGNLTLSRDHDLLDRMLELINPTWQPISVREGSEPDSFWSSLGGKTEYPREKEMKKFIEDQHLFKFTSTEGDFKVKEIYSFTQDDLTTEDVLVLDCHKEIYVWVGRHSTIKSKQVALNLGLKFLETDILEEELSLETPVYVITEGHEPPFFTCFFEWDPSKANMHGNSFERKLATLKGKTSSGTAPARNVRKAYSREATPDGQRSRSGSSNGWERSVSPASSRSGSHLKFSDNHNVSSPTPVVRKLFTGSSPYQDSPVVKPSSPSTKENSVQIDASETSANSLIYPYQRLTVVSTDPVSGIDVTKREAYLSEEEFAEKFGMPKGAFYKLPRWRQNKLKMAVDLF